MFLQKFQESVWAHCKHVW